MSSYPKIDQLFKAIIEDCYNYLLANATDSVLQSIESLKEKIKDKPEIINYDNPELAQAIGPQLLETYSSLRNQLQVTAKLNLALGLGDVVNLKRSYPEVIETSASEIKKYEGQQTYYRACKIVGINYNFAKKQMSYTLQDVSDDNNRPPIEFYEFVYTLPIRLGAK